MVYKNIVKRLFDIILSGIAIIITAVPMLIVAIAIKIDDPGPVFFTQKRVGKSKNGQITYFNIWKFRSMKTSTPSDVPTHLLVDPDQYLTRVGRFIRKASIDELPQIYQVFTGKLSIVGPRPALWLQDDLIAEREKYGANDINPGITGWAQINGRDALEIDEKARHDGEYTAAINAGNFKGFVMDMKCIFGTVAAVLMRTDIIEGALNGADTQEEKEEVTTGE